MYDTLGVSKSATEDDIKKAYKKLAMQHHPDRGGDAEMFKKISNAYETLIDPQKRAIHDNKPPPKQHEFTMNISLEDAFKGSTKTLRITRRPPCSECNGHGHIQHTIRMGPFVQTIHQLCQHCGGQGSCGEQEQLNMQINISRGTPDGAVINSNNINITIRVQSHSVFTRRGNLLRWTVEIPFADSVTGSVVTCPHFDGPVTIDTKQWCVIDPRKEYTYQDLIITFDIKYPNNLVVQ